ncbi:MAG TPA: hypothetical protein VFQ85_16290 [Mycobacteriales bacterium]|nr:hypothetical protein [Mycobacteriales bacterium]
MPRPFRLVPLLAVLLAAFALPATTGVAAACAGAVARADGWTETAPSREPVVSYAVAATAPDTIYATDGTGVYATHDGGCAWREVLGGAEPLPLGVVTRRPVAVAVSFPREVTVAWVASTVTVAGAPHPEVLVSDTTKDAFGHVAGGLQAGGTDGVLPATGNAVAIVAGTEPDYAYLLVDEATGRRLYATTDRGVSWLPRGLLSGAGAGAVRGLAADSVTGNVVWGWGDTLVRSADGGETFEPVAGAPEGPFADVAVAQSPKGARVEALTTAGRLWRSDDGGRTWSVSGSDPGGAASVAAAPVVDVAAISGPGYVSVLASVFGALWYPIGPGGSGAADVTLARFPTGDVRVAVRTGAALLRQDFPVETGDPGLGGGRPSSRVTLLRGARRIPLHPALVPGTETVRLAPGESRTVPYRLELPPTPTPVDVFFQVDTTGSMQPVIDALRQALARIVNDLTTAGIEAHFGVGSFKDYPSTSEPRDYPYQLFREIGPVDQDLQLALQRLQEGGGGDEAESQFEAIYESVHDAAGLKSFLDEPEGDTLWRPGALRIEVVATDQSSHVGDGASYPGASYEDALNGLLRAHVRTVGIAAGPNARTDLSTHAQDTGSLAPPGGIDCDADGDIDVKEGQPLVCDFAPGLGTNVPTGTPVPILDPSGARGLSGAIVAMVRAQHDPQTVRLSSSEPGVAAVVDGVHRGVDVKVPNAVEDAVRFTCTRAYYGRTTDVRLPAYVGGRLVAEGTARVACGAPGVPPPPPAPRRVEEFVPVPPRNAPLPALAVPAPAPPAPVHNLNPNTNPNAQLNSNVTTQTGVAGEEQQQPQLALAADHGAPQLGLDEELAMSARTTPPPPLLPAAAAALTAAAAYEARRRTRTTPARAR